MCSLVAHDRMQENKPDDESSIGDRVIPNDATVKALKALGATFNFIDVWIKLFLDNYNTICDAYINDMKEIFIQIPQNIERH